MTDEALKVHYDKVWEKNFKETKEFSLKVITTSDKVLAENIVKVAVNEAELNKILEANKLKVKAIKDKGPNSSVEPFPVGGAYIVFFVKDVQDAAKHKFSGEFKEEYKKIAMSDNIKIFLENEHTGSVMTQEHAVYFRHLRNGSFSIK